MKCRVRAETLAYQGRMYLTSFGKAVFILLIVFEGGFIELSQLITAAYPEKLCRLTTPMHLTVEKLSVEH